MIENLLEITNISTFYPLYVSVLLSLTLRFIWVWNIEYSFIDSICNQTRVNVDFSNILLYSGNLFNGNLPVNWLAKYIRRKESTDDNEGPLFLLALN